jgi:hypothetical protein
MKYLTDLTGIKKAIASIASRGAKLDADIHSAGVSVIAHADKHNDATLCDSLVNAMPKGARKLALVEWMLAYGRIELLDKNADKEAIENGRVFRVTKEKTFDEVGAIGTPWTEYRKEPSVQTAFDVQAAVASVMSRLTAATKGKKDIQNRTAALAEARALVAALETPAPTEAEAPL